jgi:hypothetical protein
MKVQIYGPVPLHARETNGRNRAEFAFKSSREATGPMPFLHSARRSQIPPKGAISGVSRQAGLGVTKPGDKSTVNCGFSALVEPPHPF